MITKIMGITAIPQSKIVITFFYIILIKGFIYTLLSSTSCCPSGAPVSLATGLCNGGVTSG